MKTTLALCLLACALTAAAQDRLPEPINTGPRILDPFYPSPFAERGWNQGAGCASHHNLPNGDTAGTCKYSGVGGFGYANVVWGKDGLPKSATICFPQPWQGTPPCHVIPKID